jgi:hypothetical protein
MSAKNIFIFKNTIQNHSLSQNLRKIVLDFFSSEISFLSLGDNYLFEEKRAFLTKRRKMDRKA